MPIPDIRVIKIGASEYPRRLAQIADPPAALYCRGNTELLDSPCLAIVGTRKITPYGRQAAEYFATAIASRGFTVVSGLALGVDAVAHRATLDADGATIAVLGTGIGHLYPKENEKLATDIIARGGLVVSEYPDTTPGLKGMFPRRNRIIAGLSVGTVVIEADRRSGALITAACALEQNRDVFAVPGNIFSPRSAGPNLLIQQGAKLALTPEDVVQEYAGQQELFSSRAPSLSTQDPIAQKILGILDTDGPVHLDELIQKTKEASAKVMAAVSILEIQNLVANLGNGTYKRR